MDADCIIGEIESTSSGVIEALASFAESMILFCPDFSSTCMSKPVPVVDYQYKSNSTCLSLCNCHFRIIYILLLQTVLKFPREFIIANSTDHNRFPCIIG